MPDYDTQRTFYKDTWGLTEVGTDGDLSYLAAEGSPEQYVIRLRKDADKRLDLISFGADRRRRRRRARRQARHRGHPAGRRARQAADRRRRLRLPVLRHRRPHHRDLQRRRDPAAPRDRGGRGDPGPHLARGDEHQRPEHDPRLLREHPRLQALGHALGRAHGRDDALHAVQRLAPQPGDRARPAHLGAPRVVRDARPRRVHARHRPRDARRHQEDLGPGPPQRRQQHVLLLPRPERQHDGVHDRAREDRDRPVAPERLRHRRPDDPGPVGHRRPDVARSSPATPSTTPTRASSSPRRSDGASLDGKVVVVTGAARGQGAAEVEALARAGATVVATDVLDEEGDHAGQDAGRGGPRRRVRHLDVTRPRRPGRRWPTWLARRARPRRRAGQQRRRRRPRAAARTSPSTQLAADLRHQRHRPDARHPGAGAADGPRLLDRQHLLGRRDGRPRRGGVHLQQVGAARPDPYGVASSSARAASGSTP